MQNTYISKKGLNFLFVYSRNPGFLDRYQDILHALKNTNQIPLYKEVSLILSNIMKLLLIN